eukprot:331666_1
MAGWISMMIDFITYYILLLNDKVKRIAGGMFAALMTGIEEKVFKNNTGDTLTCSCCSSAPEAFTEYEIMIEQQRVHSEIRNSIRRDTERKKLLLLGTESLLAPCVVNENEPNNDDLVGFDYDISSMLIPSIFASRSSS